MPDWERQGSAVAGPALSSLTPDPPFRGRRGVRPGSARRWQGRHELQAFVQVGVAKEDQPHYLRVHRPAGASTRELIALRPGLIARRASERRGRPPTTGVISARADLRIRRSTPRFEDSGFETIANVSLLMKETLVRVAEPALVPAVLR